MAALSSSIMVISYDTALFTATQATIFNVTRSISNDSAESGNNLTLAIKDGDILPTNCYTKRNGNCYDDKNWIVYVLIDNGTATLPQHFGVRNYTLREGYAIVPLNNMVEK